MSFKTIETQEQLDAIIQDRVIRAKESAKKEFEGFISPEEFTTKTAEITAQKDKALADYNALNESFNKLQTEKDDWKSKANKYEMDSVKTNVAIEFGLPINARQFLMGDSEEAIRASAKSFEEVYRSNTKAAPLASTDEPVKNEKHNAYSTMLNNIHK